MEDLIKKILDNLTIWVVGILAYSKKYFSSIMNWKNNNFLSNEKNQFEFLIPKT